MKITSAWRHLQINSQRHNLQEKKTSEKLPLDSSLCLVPCKCPRITSSYVFHKCKGCVPGGVWLWGCREVLGALWCWSHVCVDPVQRRCWSLLGSQTLGLEHSCVRAQQTFTPNGKFGVIWPLEVGSLRWIFFQVTLLKLIFPLRCAAIPLESVHPAPLFPIFLTTMVWKYFFQDNKPVFSHIVIWFERFYLIM